MYKFTKSAEKAINVANDVAIEFGHNYVGTEHLLYGLVKEGTGVASKVLESQGVVASTVFDKVEELIGKEDTIDRGGNGTIRFYPKVKKNYRKCI